MALVADDFVISDVPFTHDPWVAERTRYDTMPYRRVGSSGLLLPAISLGLWYNFGDNRPFPLWSGDRRGWDPQMYMAGSM